MNEDLAVWDQSAGDWDKVAQQGKYRTYLIEGAMTELFPDISGKSVLDAGCGNGYFTEWLSKRGTDATGFDGSKELVELARKTYPALKFETHDLLQPIPVGGSVYDIVLANMLLMHLANVSVFIGEAYRLLKPGGQFVFSVLHPAFNHPTSKLYKSLWDKITFAKPSSIAFDYFSGETGRYESHMGSKLTHYHRTIEEYSKELEKAGLVIKTILEPHKLPEEFLKQNPKFEYAQRLPRFIFFNCTRP